jgi:hypothetical protein
MVQSRSSLDQEAREIRRNRVLEVMSSHHYPIRVIADMLNLKPTTVQRDVTYWERKARKETQDNFQSIPLEIKKGLVLCDMSIEKLTDMIDDSTSSKEQIISAINARGHMLELKHKLLDGKTRVDRVIESIESHTRTLVLTSQNTEVLKDGSI